MLFAAAGSLVIAYAALSIPEPRPKEWPRADKQPFYWKQDAKWTELERTLESQRKIPCEISAANIESRLTIANQHISVLSRAEVPPSDALWQTLENEVFELAPLVAACPKFVAPYSQLVIELRSRAKNISRSWNMDTPEVRERLYRLLTGSRMALEEVLLQSPNEVFPPVLRGADEPSATPVAEVRGVKVHSGDILVSRGGAPTSALIARGNDFPGTFSHVALLHIDEHSGKVSLIESHIERGVAVSSLEDYLNDVKLRIMVLRLRHDLPIIQKDPLLPHRAASLCLTQAGQGHIPYDFQMDFRDHRAQFCSEVASAAYDQVGIRLWMGLSHISSPTVAAWLGSLGVRHFETQEPSDLEYDPQLSVVAEWRTPEALMKAHVDDAVTDAMLMAAPEGSPLDYNAAMLPVTRLVKGYSWLLNLMGKIGPVPEGMSATTALRVKAFREAHSNAAAQVMQRADAFRQQHGYAVPYWELVQLADSAIKER